MTINYFRGFMRGRFRDTVGWVDSEYIHATVDALLKGDLIIIRKLPPNDWRLNWELEARNHDGTRKLGP